MFVKLSTEFARGCLTNSIIVIFKNVMVPPLEKIIVFVTVVHQHLDHFLGQRRWSQHQGVDVGIRRRKSAI